MKINFNRLTSISLRQKITDIFVTALKETNNKNNMSVNITIVGEKTIKNLNKEYRNVDRVTDVLSFPLNDEEDYLSSEFKLEQVCTDLGDIVICLKKAKQQAQEYGHSEEREICFLALHGLLHLIGFDHITKKQESEMFYIQEKVLKKNNIGR